VRVKILTTECLKTACDATEELHGSPAVWWYEHESGPETSGGGRRDERTEPDDW